MQEIRALRREGFLAFVQDTTGVHSRWHSLAPLLLRRDSSGEGNAIDTAGRVTCKAYLGDLSTVFAVQYAGQSDQGA
jgi:hypothetical protein